MALMANAAANIMLKSGMRTLDFKGLAPIAVLVQIIGNKMLPPVSCVTKRQFDGQNRVMGRGLCLT